VSAIVFAGLDGIPEWQARQTFAIARHAVVDLSQVLVAPPRHSDRLDAIPSDRIIEALRSAGFHFKHGDDAALRLTHLRKMYEPYVAGLSEMLAMPLPAWVRDGATLDNWETTPKRDIETHL